MRWCRRGFNGALHSPSTRPQSSPFTPLLTSLPSIGQSTWSSHAVLTLHPQGELPPQSRAGQIRRRRTHRLSPLRALTDVPAHIHPPTATAHAISTTTTMYSPCLQCMLDIAQQLDAIAQVLTELHAAQPQTDPTTAERLRDIALSVLAIDRQFVAFTQRMNDMLRDRIQKSRAAKQNTASPVPAPLPPGRDASQHVQHLQVLLACYLDCEDLEEAEQPLPEMLPRGGMLSLMRHVHSGLEVTTTQLQGLLATWQHPWRAWLAYALAGSAVAATSYWALQRYRPAWVQAALTTARSKPGAVVALLLALKWVHSKTAPAGTLKHLQRLLGMYTRVWTLAMDQVLTASESSKPEAAAPGGHSSPRQHGAPSLALGSPAAHVLSQRRSCSTLVSSVPTDAITLSTWAEELNIADARHHPQLVNDSQIATRRMILYYTLPRAVPPWPTDWRSRALRAVLQWLYATTSVSGAPPLWRANPALSCTDEDNRDPDLTSAPPCGAHAWELSTSSPWLRAWQHSCTVARMATLGAAAGLYYAARPRVAQERAAALLSRGCDALFVARIWSGLDRPIVAAVSRSLTRMRVEQSLSVCRVPVQLLAGSDIPSTELSALTGVPTQAEAARWKAAMLTLDSLYAHTTKGACLATSHAERVVRSAPAKQAAGVRAVRRIAARLVRHGLTPAPAACSPVIETASAATDPHDSEPELAPWQAQVHVEPKIEMYSHTYGKPPPVRPAGAVSQPEQEPRYLIVVHGGGFVASSYAPDRARLATLCEQDPHLRIVYVHYSIAPAKRFPVAVNQVLRVYAVIRERITSRVELTGDSAGGNLVAAAVHRILCAGLPAPSKVHLVYAALNLSSVPSPSRVLHLGDPMVCFGLLVALADAYGPLLSDAQHEAAAVSCGEQPQPPAHRSAEYQPGTVFVDNVYMHPLLASDELLAAWPPCNIIVGGADPLQDDSVDFSARLRKLGVPGETAIYRDLPHGWLQFPWLSTADHASARVRAWLTADA